MCVCVRVCVCVCECVFSDKFVLVSFIIEITILNANSVGADQMPLNAASDLGLHCLPTSFLWKAMHKRSGQMHCKNLVVIGNWLPARLPLMFTGARICSNHPTRQGRAGHAN